MSAGKGQPQHRLIRQRAIGPMQAEAEAEQADAGRRHRQQHHDRGPRIEPRRPAADGIDAVIGDDPIRQKQETGHRRIPGEDGRKRGPQKPPQQQARPPGPG